MAVSREKTKNLLDFSDKKKPDDVPDDSEEPKEACPWRKQGRTKTKLPKRPGDLKNWCSEYFEWCEDNPLYEKKVMTWQGEVKIKHVPKPRAMTQWGLRIHLGISKTTWQKWRATADDGFKEVIDWAESVIADQKFTKAAAELMNPNLIALSLGLSHKNEISGPNGGPIKTEGDAVDIAKRMAFLLRKGQKEKEQ